MIEKDTRAYWQGKHTFSLKTPLTTDQFESVLQSVVGGVMKPDVNSLQATMTRYYGSIYEGEFQLKKTLPQSRHQEPIVIEGQYKEKGIGTSLEISIYGTQKYVTIISVLFFIIVSVIAILQDASSNWFFALFVLGAGVGSWAFSMNSIWQQVETEMIFLAKLLDEAEGTLLGKAVYKDEETNA